MIFLKKVFLLIGLIGLLFLYSGCSGPQAGEYAILEPNDSDLHVTMKNYYAADCLAQTGGEFFQAKLLQGAKIPTFNTEGEPTTDYFYHIIIAPRTEMPLYEVGFRMLPGKLAQDYFSNKLNEDINSGSSSDLRWDKMINPMSTKSEFVCFDFYISWNNLGNAYFESSQIQLSSFDQAMSQITIMIQYNDFHCETLELSIQPKIHEVSSLEDPIAKKDRIVSSFLKGKPFGKVRKYFYKDLCLEWSGGEY